MLPEITELKLPQGTEEVESNQGLGKSFLFDFKENDFVLKNGRPVVVNNTEAIKIWVEKVLRTQKMKWRIYEDSDYGTTIEDLIVGHGYPMSFLESELKREITEALLKHPKIQSVSEWEFKREKDLLYLYFKVNLIDGETFDKGVRF